MKVFKLKKNKTKVKKKLLFAIEQDFDDVLIFGQKKGKYHILGTGNSDRMLIIGLLETAKFNLTELAEWEVPDFNLSELDEWK